MAGALVDVADAARHPDECAPASRSGRMRRADINTPLKLGVRPRQGEGVFALWEHDEGEAQKSPFCASGKGPTANGCDSHANGNTTAASV